VRRFRKARSARDRSQLPAIWRLHKNPRTCFEGPFGEVIRATGPMAKANPFRFSTKYQDDETDLLYYGYRYYNASTGRWLSRDPIDEPGFQLFQRAQVAQGEPITIAQQASRWISRDSTGKGSDDEQSADVGFRPSQQSPYPFVSNDPNNSIDALGLAKFEGCTDEEAKKLQASLDDYCKQARTRAFGCCVWKAKVSDALAALCADTSILTIKCEHKNKGRCKDSCGWSMPYGNTVHICPLGLKPDPGCGPFGCTLLHEMTHTRGHPGERWPNRVENCLHDCPNRPE
jgi:RHS repeat-associated protein